MSSNYSKHIVGANYSDLIESHNLPLIDYPLNCEGDCITEGMSLSEENLRSYLSNEANKNAYNQSFMNIRTENYANNEHICSIDALTGERTLLNNNVNLKLNYFDINEFGAQSLERLVENEADFASIILDEQTVFGTEYSTIALSNGQTISIDPEYAPSQIPSIALAGTLAGGIGFPLIYSGLRKLAYSPNKEGKIEGLLRLSAGAVPVGFFAKNLSNSIINYKSADLMTKLIGHKAIALNIGSFFLGNSIYNLISGIKNSRKKQSRGKGIAEISCATLEGIAGGLLINAGTSSWTSLAYEGGGVFSLLTQSAATYCAMIPLAIGLGVAGLAIKLGHYLYKRKKNTKVSKEYELNAKNHACSFFKKLKKNKPAPSSGAPATSP